MPTLALARNAMNSRFEILLHGENEVALRAAAEEALEEIEKLHAQLSLYTATSELSQINARAAREPVRVEPRLFRLLQRAQQIHRETGGSFDITIAPLMRAWGFVRNTGKLPEPAELAAARNCVGMNLVHLDEREFTVRFARPGVVLDLGAIGKGYALDRMAAQLSEWAVSAACLQSGGSTALALAAPTGASGWPIGIGDGATHRLLPLTHAALSGSGIAVQGAHLIDPRTSSPSAHVTRTWALAPTAALSDALSTAFFILPDAEIAAFCATHPEIGAARARSETSLTLYGTLTAQVSL